MTKQFTTPCFIRKNTRQLKSLLTDIGYMTGEVQATYGNCIAVYQNAFNYHIAISLPETSCKINKLIDCGTNEALFIDLAAMRIDTDKGQLLTRNGKGLRRCNYDNVLYDKTFSAHWRKATATEIIEWHKQKGEKK